MKLTNQEDSRRHSRREFARACRICACLNRAIRKNYKIQHWQKICIDYYYELDDEKKQEIL